MASITFEGPNLAGGRSVTTVTMSDEALLAVVEAVTVSEGYTGDSPGLFVIQKTIAGWQHVVELFQKNKAIAIANEQVESALAPLKESVSIAVEEIGNAET